MIKRLSKLSKLSISKFFLPVLLIAALVLPFVPATPVSADGAAPLISSLRVEGFGRDWVTLVGEVTDDQGSTLNSIGFDYGLTDAYGSSETATGSWDDTTNPTFQLTITDLPPASVYHWRAKGSYVDSATGYGSDMYCTTTGSPVIYEYLNTGGDGDSTDIYANNWLAQQFTAGSTSHTVTSIRLYLKRTGASPGTVTVSIKHADAAHKPTGDDICSGTLDGDTFSDAYSWYEFEVDETSLEADGEYAVVVRAIAGTDANDIQWKKDTGGSLADAVGLHSADNGISWTSDTPIDYLFEIWGNPCISIESAAVFYDYLETGDLLFVTEYENIYPPYFPWEDSAQYFDVRLYDTDGTTVIASTTCEAWGNKPASIYLSADEAGPLTLSSAYYIKLRGSFTGNPVAAYQLAAGDWRGTDLTYLDKWCLLTAHSMEDYYNSTLTVYVAQKGEVLNEEGGVIFDNGINALSAVRPDLFQTTVNLPKYDLTSWTNAFQSAESWEVQVGTEVVSEADAIATVLGVDDKDIVIWGLVLVYMILAIFLLARGQIMFALVLAAPFMFFGAWLRVIDIVLVGLVVAVLALIFVWQTWWSTT